MIHLPGKGINKLVPVTVLLFVLMGSFSSLYAQSLSDIKIKEYYWGTPLPKILHDLRYKYKVQIVYDSLLVQGYKLDYMFDNTAVPVAVDVIFRNNPDLSYFIDDKNVVQVLPRSVLNASKLTATNKHYKGKPVKFNFTATGIVKDKLSGEPLPYASILINGSSRGCTSNVDGYFTLPNIPTDTSAILVFYLGYYKQLFYLSPDADLNNISVLMDPLTTQLKTIEVKGEREDLLKASEGGNLIKMSPAKIAELPSLGEKDIFRTFHHKLLTLREVIHQPQT